MARSRKNKPAPAPFSERHAGADLRRLEPTPAEAELARILRELGAGALAGEFRREWPMGDWIVDFYFPTIKLAIEVDGGYHRAQSRWRLDLHKTRDLQERGITVLRLVNAEVFGDRERLVARLRAAWRAAAQNVRRGPTTLREPRCTAYRVAAGLSATFLMLRTSAREFGGPLTVSQGAA